MEYRLVLVDDCIIPTEVTLFKDNYKIRDIDKCYHIKNYKLEVNERDEIVNIYVKGIHPNVNPETELYCCPVPIDLMSLYYTDYRSIEFIENQLLKRFFLDISYFSYKHIKYAMRFLMKTNFDTRIFIKIDIKYAFPGMSNLYPDPGSKKFKEIVNRCNK